MEEEEEEEEDEEEEELHYRFGVLDDSTAKQS